KAAHVLFEALQPFASSVAEFVKDPKSAAESGSMREVREQLGRLIDQRRGRGRFVIFVDDLERCKLPRAVDVLEVINQLLAHPGVVTIVLADMPAVIACAELKYKALIDRYRPTVASTMASSPVPQAYGRAYLKKIIQLQFDLPLIPAHKPAPPGQPNGQDLTSCLTETFCDWRQDEENPLPVPVPAAPSLLQRLSAWL